VSYKCLSITVARLLVASACCMTASAADLVVDQKHPQANDQNPGTLEAPFKTIQTALDKAQPGDTVQVRGGVYRESVKFKRGGSYPGGMIETWSPQNLKWVTLEAYRDERVRLDGSTEIPAGDWELVDGCTNTYVAPFVSKGFRKLLQMVLVSDELLLPTLVQNPDPNMPERPMLAAKPGDRPEDSGWFYDKDKDLLYVNIGGRVPGKDAQVSASQLDTGVDAANQTFIRIRKLEVRGFNGNGICVYNAHEFIVEDNYVHLCRIGVYGGPSGKGSIRRNFLTDLTRPGMGLGGAQGTVVEGNVIKRWHINPYRDNYYSCALMCNNCSDLGIRYNVITENIRPDAGGPWPDCASTGISAYGNTIYNLKGNGFYIEAGILGTVLRWNTIFETDSGITFRANCANVAFQNYVFNCRGGGLNISSPDQEDVEPKANTMMYNWLIDNGAGAGTDPDRDKEIANVFDHNTYKLAKESPLFVYSGKRYVDIEELRKDLGQEIHGKVVDTFDPKPLGLVTFRVQGTKNDWKPVPMFGNPTTARTDVRVNWPELYFWYRGNFRDAQAYGWQSAPNVKGMGGQTLPNSSGFLRQIWMNNIAYNNTYPGATVENFNDDPTAARNKKVCLQVCSLPGKALVPDGLGYWSVDLPTVDGAKIDVSAWIKAKGVTPTSASGGVYLLVEFRNVTGQNLSRQYIVGAEDGDQAVLPDFAAGTYDHKQAAATVTAPKNARWFRVGFGVRDASGWASFGDIDIQTQPGEEPEEVARKTRPIEPAHFNWSITDISPMLNRPLADEVDADGKGGWTDQGALMDLRGLPSGEQTINGVSFRVEKGNACLILKNKQRPSENLPAAAKVNVTFKADVLAFLHTGGWLAPDIRHATYIVHYADGTKAEIPVIGGKNIIDWTHSADSVDEVKYSPALGLILHAVTVPSPKFVRVNVWMTLWKNPHPDKEIVALEVTSANEGIPGLIAVSRGIAR